MKPEEKARKRIDDLLKAASWNDARGQQVEPGAGGAESTDTLDQSYQRITESKIKGMNGKLSKGWVGARLEKAAEAEHSEEGVFRHAGTPGSNR